MKRILTIAGSDSGGGAGIQADLKTITVLGAFGMTVITALTAQNTVGVQAIQEVPLNFISKQFDSLLSDIGVDAAKTGMLATIEVVKLISEKVKQYHIDRLVVDPVMVAKSGDYLLKKDAIKTLKKELLPLAFVVTPNIPEASALIGKKIKDPSDMRDAAKIIFEMGPKNVLIKGGHLKNCADDLLYDGKIFHKFPANRIETENTHGTGCTYSAAIATFLGKGYNVVESVFKAKSFITNAIKYSLNIGKGHGPVNPYASLKAEIEPLKVIDELKKAYFALKELPFHELIPEVGTNFGFALSNATSYKDIAAFPGRIHRFKGEIRSFTCYPEFGSSRHIASIILAAMNHDKHYRSCINIRFDQDILNMAAKKNMDIGFFKRALEPKDVKAKEGATLEWGTSYVIKEKGHVPDIIYDEGEIGKEKMIRILGKNPFELIDKIKMILGV
ncbi:MAG: bifunctional hydroxymethylpyrimidine kinase/phosphomethylpyrimidine kinase [Deltaproteobacteria bacterium]|nr:bifunctional hydroxymethylpyrimidine kinase/phosphomethylpyrimidine kinase [Deltaproteobacteria bacterium]